MHVCTYVNRTMYMYMYMIINYPPVSLGLDELDNPTD